MLKTWVAAGGPENGAFEDGNRPELHVRGVKGVQLPRPGAVVSGVFEGRTKEPMAPL